MSAALLISLIGCTADTTMSPYVDWTVGPDGRFTEVLEQSFVAGSAAVVTIDNFTGAVTYRPGEPGIVRVKAIKRAAMRANLDRIDVTMTAGANGIVIRTGNPDSLKKVAVDLEITAPADAHPHINNGVGSINYRGRPAGLCSFSTAVGTVTLSLDSNVGIMVDLTTAVGMISVDFPVAGSVRSRVVRGRIGNGDEGRVHASAGVGNIYLVRR
jgi:hypothetical protein